VPQLGDTALVVKQADDGIAVFSNEPSAISPPTGNAAHSYTVKVYAVDAVSPVTVHDVEAREVMAELQVAVMADALHPVLSWTIQLVNLPLTIKHNNCIIHYIEKIQYQN
jgi:hypothetical protein